jgi:membrane-bound serine protease (ClpP class)
MLASGRFSFVFRLLFCAGFCAMPTGVYAQEAVKSSLFIPVVSPIEGNDVSRLKSRIDSERRKENTTLDKVVFDFNPDNKDSSSPSYGNSYELASFIRELTLNGITTVAYVSKRVTGHSVLPVLACGELCMSPNGQLGQVVENQAAPPPEEQVQYYLSLAKPEHRGLIHKMCDRNVEVFSGLRKESLIYFDGRKKNEPQFADVLNVKPVPDMNPGVTEIYNQIRAQRFGLCLLVKDSREQVAEWYGVNLKAGVATGTGKACKIEIVGAVDAILKDKLRRQLQETASRKESAVFLIFNSDGGGDPKIARELADELADLRDVAKNPIRTIAFIPVHAPDLAGILALACSEIVMVKSNQADGDAVIADFEGYLNNPNHAGAFEFLKVNLPDILQSWLAGSAGGGDDRQEFRNCTCAESKDRRPHADDQDRIRPCGRRPRVEYGRPFEATGQLPETDSLPGQRPAGGNPDFT